MGSLSAMPNNLKIRILPLNNIFTFQINIFTFTSIFNIILLIINNLMCNAVIRKVNTLMLINKNLNIQQK